MLLVCFVVKVHGFGFLRFVILACMYKIKPKCRSNVCLSACLSSFRMFHLGKNFTVLDYELLTSRIISKTNYVLNNNHVQLFSSLLNLFLYSFLSFSRILKMAGNQNWTIYNVTLRSTTSCRIGDNVHEALEITCWIAFNPLRKSGYLRAWIEVSRFMFRKKKITSANGPIHHMKFIYEFQRLAFKI